MKHVLFVAGWWPTEDQPLNGIFVQEHALAISRYAKVTVVYIQHMDKSTSLSDFPSHVSKDITHLNENLQVYTYSLKFRIRRFGILEWQLTKLFKDLINQFEKTIPVDVIHINIVHFFIPSLVLKNSNKFKKPILISENSTFLHTEIYHLQPEEIEQTKNKFRGLLNTPYLKYMLPVSKQLGDVFVNDYLVPSAKIEVVANVANDCFINTSISPAITQNTIIIFATAIWQHSKDPLLFFNMLIRLRNDKPELYTKLKINWGGGGVYMDTVKPFVKAELSDLKIEFLGRIDKPTIANHLQRSHFLVHPTIAENLPCIIIESLCSGVPVLTANVNGCSELISSSNGILYKAGDIESFYSNFLKMIDNLSTFNKQEIASDARKNYSSETIGKKMVAIYETLC